MNLYNYLELIRFSGLMSEHSQKNEVTLPPDCAMIRTIVRFFEV